MPGSEAGFNDDGVTVRGQVEACHFIGSEGVYFYTVNGGTSVFAFSDEESHQVGEAVEVSGLIGPGRPTLWDDEDGEIDYYLDNATIAWG